MKKGFVITGILFGFALILLISTNYVILSENNSTEYIILQTDAVQNRAVDVHRIITDAIADGKCSNLDEFLSNSILDSEGITVTHTSDLTSCPNPIITVQLDSANVHKEFTY